MNKTVITGVVCFVFGSVLALLIVIPLMLADAFENRDPIRIENRIMYSSDGRIKEAYFSFPTFEAYYDAVAKESGFSIATENLPNTSNSLSMKDVDWDSVIRVGVPAGYEAILVTPKNYKIQKKELNKAALAQRP